VTPPSAGSEPAAPARPTVTVATYENYVDAQRLVDYLSDNQFPVQHTKIVGTDLRLVETVVGRMTTVARPSPPGQRRLVRPVHRPAAGHLHALELVRRHPHHAVHRRGLGRGLRRHRARRHRGRRDFTSRSQLQASQYAVTVDAEHADTARHMVVQMGWKASGAL